MRQAAGWIQQRHDVVRWAVTALVVVVIAHQFVMLLPAHEHAMAMIAPAPHAATEASHECKGLCPPAVIKQCAATEAVFRTALASLLALVVTVLLTGAVTPIVRLHWSLREWLWPPDRRRAFLQVFLC